MPILERIVEGKHFRFLFVHIPKTGGDSIEIFFRNNGWSVTKYNNNCGLYDQHAPYNVYREWGKFNGTFTVVRNPLTRMVSELNFRHIPKEQANQTVQKWLAEVQTNPQLLDNHIRPQVDFLCPKINLLKFEGNFMEQVQNVFKLIGNPPHTHNHSADPNRVRVEDLHPDTINLIQDYYEDDYKAFKYPLWQGNEN